MGKVRFSLAALAIAACLPAGYRVHALEDSFAASGAVADSRATLFAQSAAQILTREFRDEEISFLFLDARSGALLAARWPDPDQPIPLGSLVKPFTALAYAQHHDYRYPTYVCHGKAGGCWQPRSHGRLGIASALAFSCNSYFRELAGQVNVGELQELSAQFSLDRPDSRLAGPSLIGIGEKWLISPMHIAQGYLELARRRDEPGVREILAGLADSAEWGTGSGVGHALPRTGALVKTGTAVCRHPHHAPADGFAIALTPAESPEFLLLVRVHGVPGATAAATAGQMFARLEP